MVRGDLCLGQIKTLKKFFKKIQWSKIEKEREGGRCFCPNVSYFSHRVAEGGRGVRVKEEPLMRAGGDLVLPEEAVVPQLGDPLFKQLSRLHLEEEEVVVVVVSRRRSRGRRWWW